MRCFLIFLCIPLLLFFACENETLPATDLLADLLAIPNNNPPAADIYFAAGEADARIDAILLPLYGTDTTVLLRIADYAVFLGRGTDLYEIHVLRAVGPSDIPILRSLLTARAKMICLSTEEGHPTERAAIVCESGLYLYLFATPHNGALQQEITA